MAKLGFSSWLLLAVLTSQAVWARPQQQKHILREAKLITVPRPGQEYVSIQSSVFSAQPAKAKEATEGDFATSHRIPGDLPVDDPEDLDIKYDVESSKTKRQSNEPLKIVQEAILTPEVLLPLVDAPPKIKTEMRTEFSVVTSKPRKEMKDAEKVAPTEKKVLTKAQLKEDAVKDVEVEIDSKGEYGKLAANVTGSDEKKVMLTKKAHNVAAKEVAKVEQILQDVEVNTASEVGVKSPKVVAEVGAITVPAQKQTLSTTQQVSSATVEPQTTEVTASENFDILAVNHPAVHSDSTKEKDFDFVDSVDQVLVPAGSNQQSRIEVKKGPNGQDYEYEYVYYYYDDDENDTTADAGDKKPVAKASATTAAPTAAPTTERATTTSRQYLPEVVLHEKDTSDHSRTRSRNRVQGQHAATVAATGETDIVKQEVAGRNTNKYAAVERTASTATPETSNEIIPARGTQTRFRGRAHAAASTTTEEPATISVEERLPANTRFPPRSRSNHNSNSIPTTTPLAQPQDAPAPAPSSRVRGGASANSVRRPSLELVDSSSFKTHSSDASRDQDLRPEFPSSLPDANEEEEEVVKPVRGSRVRGTTTTTAATPVDVDDEEDEDISDAPRRGQPIRRPAAKAPTSSEEDDDVVDEPSVPELPAEEAELTLTSDITTTSAEDVGLTAAVMDKAAIELYSLFQQAQAENSIDEESTDLSAEDDLTTEVEELTTTELPTTLPPTTTTTTTTPAPTTTTTTTTEAPTTAATGRGRYRQRPGGAAPGATRNRFNANRSDGTTTTTTTETPAETSTKARARFGANRVSSGSYGRRGFQKSTTAQPEESDSETEVKKEVATKVEAVAPPARTGGFSRNRFSATRPSRVTTTTSAPSDESASSASSPAPAKPVFVDRFNSLRRRGGLKTSTTAAPEAEDTKSESSGEESNDPSTPAEAASTTVKPIGRTRLSIGSGPRPLRPGPRVNIGGRGRLGVTTTTTTTSAPSTEADEASNEQTSSSSQEESQSPSDEGQEAVTTPIPDALTRLRNRPRLRVNAVKPPTTAAVTPVRRPLGLLPRRRPQPAEVKEASQSETQESSNTSSDESESSSSSDETSEPSTDATSSATTIQEPQDNNRLTSLTGRRRGNALRRPRTLLLPGGRPGNKDLSS